MKRLNVDFLKIAKISLGCCLSVLVANWIGLTSSTSAGIITLLSIQNTKRETLTVAARRAYAFFAAMLAAYLTFAVLGYHVVSFGIFLLLFTLFCYLTGLETGIATNTVLVTHLWASHSMAFPLVLNEFYLLCIGIAVAVVVNLYMPSILEDIRRDQNEIDSALEKLIRGIARRLTLSESGELQEEFQSLEQKIRDALTRAYQYSNNSLATDMRYYVQYLQMRKSQCTLLRRIAANLDKINCVTGQGRVIAGFMGEISHTLRDYDNAEGLLTRLEALREGFRTGPLPGTRPEFEARAILFHILIDLEYLLLAKKNFAASLTPWQIEYFWTGEKLKYAQY